MRITNEMSFRMLNSNILKSQQSVYESQQRLSSGKQLLSPSDDPGTYERIELLKEDNSYITQYLKNIESARHEMLATENTLHAITDIFSRASELTISAGDATASTEDRQSMGQGSSLEHAGRYDLQVRHLY